MNQTTRPKFGRPRCSPYNICIIQKGRTAILWISYS